MSVQSIDCRPVIYIRQQFEDEVRDLPTEERVVDYIHFHRLEFLNMGEALKIKKKQKYKYSADQSHGTDRSNHLLQSLVILPGGIVFRTGREKQKMSYRSKPGGRETFLLGSGSFKQVFKVEDLATKKQVAVACVWAETLGKFLRHEYEITQLVQSPHILPIQCYGARETAKGVKKFYAVSELCEGSLEDKDGMYLQKHPENFSQIRRALDACHAAGVTHNDVHPRNILIKSNGDAVLADFGIAERFDEDLLELPDSWVLPLAYFWRQVLLCTDDLGLADLQRISATENLSFLKAFLFNLNWFMEDHYGLGQSILLWGGLVRGVKREVVDLMKEARKDFIEGWRTFSQNFTDKDFG